MRLAELLAELLSEPLPRRLFLARNIARYRSPFLCRFALEAGFAKRFEDKDTTLAATQVAAAIADGLQSRDVAPPETPLELRAEAHAYLANALRICSRFPEAEAEFDRAYAALSAGVSRPALTARVLELEASLRDTLRQLDRALSLLSQAADIHEQIGNGKSLGSVLVQMAIAEGYLGRPATAVRLLKRAQELISQPQQCIAFLSALAVNLLEAGFPILAEATLYELKAMVPAQAEKLMRLRVEWLEARIDAATGQFLVAAERFHAVRVSFEEQEMLYESAQVALEHAHALADADRAHEARPLLLEVQQVFDVLGVEREAVAARLLRRSLADECTAEILRATVLSFRRVPRRVLR